MSIKRLWLPYLFYLSVLLLLSTYLWSFRAHYINKFDPVYSSDLYDHSQWSVSDSTRTIGDDGRYEIAAYRLINGGKLYEVAPEVPPLGKYLIGCSQKYFHNSSIIAIPFTIITIITFFFLSRHILTTSNKPFLATLLFVLSPQIINNIYRATLDLPQICMLLVHLLFLFKAVDSNKNKQKWVYIIFSAIALGCFISIKFGIFVLPVLIADIYLLYKKKQLALIIPVIVLMPVIYFLTTIQFFLYNDSGTLAAWLAAQKWILNFYKTSNTGFIPFMAVFTIITSLYKGWWNTGWERTTEWSVIMPFGLGALLFALRHKLRGKINFNDKDSCILIYSTLTIFLLSFIAFWPRYLILVTPFLILIFIKFLSETKYFKSILTIVLICIIIQAVNLLFPQPDEFISSFKNNMQNATYQEVFGMIDPDSQLMLNRDLFWRELLESDSQLQTVIPKKVQIKSGFTLPWQNDSTISIKTEYQTPVGTYKHQHDAKIIRIQNQWKLKWSWEIIAPHFNPADTIEVKITDIDLLPAQPFIYITPQKIRDENSLVYDVAEITAQKRYIVIKKYLQNSPPDWPAPIGFAAGGFNPSLLEKIATNPAVTVKKLPGLSYGTHSGIITLQKKDGKRFVLLYTPTVLK